MTLTIFRQYVVSMSINMTTNVVTSGADVVFLHWYTCVCRLVQGWAAENEDYAAARWCSSLHHGVSQTGQWQWNKQRQVSKCKDGDNVSSQCWTLLVNQMSCAANLLSFMICFVLLPRMRLLGRTPQVWRKDGLNSCSYKTLSVERFPLYVNVTVDIGKPQSWDFKQDAPVLWPKNILWYILYGMFRPLSAEKHTKYTLFSLVYIVELS